MFELQIEQGRALIRKFEYLIEQSENEVPLSKQVFEEEFWSWVTSTESALSMIFGPKSSQVERWVKLAHGYSRGTDKIIWEKGKKSELYTWDIRYLFSAINMLIEFETYIKHSPINTQQPKDLQEALIYIFWQSLIGRLLILATLIVGVIFAVWQSLPDELKNRILAPIFP